MDIKSITPVRRVLTELGIELPFERNVRRNGKPTTVSGVVFIPFALLEELSEQGRWTSEFGNALILSTHQGYALEEHGLAVQETRGGYHGTEKTTELVAHLSNIYETAVDPLGEDSVNDLIENHSWSAEAVRAWFRKLRR